LEKVAKISTARLILKAQNIYIQPLLKLCNTYDKPWVETAWIGENWLSKK
jgi:hypothetical protein